MANAGSLKSTSCWVRERPRGRRVGCGVRWCAELCGVRRIRMRLRGARQGVVGLGDRAVQAESGARAPARRDRGGSGGPWRRRARMPRKGGERAGEGKRGKGGKRGEKGGKRDGGRGGGRREGEREEWGGCKRLHAAGHLHTLAYPRTHACTRACTPRPGPLPPSLTHPSPWPSPSLTHARTHPSPWASPSLTHAPAARARGRTARGPSRPQRL